MTVYVRVNLPHAYIFKCLIQYLSVFNAKGDLIFYEQGIGYDRACDSLSDLSGDRPGNIINQFLIRAENILQYHWNKDGPHDTDFRSVPCYRVGIAINTVYSAIKSLKKKSTLDIIVQSSHTSGSKYEISFMAQGSMNLITCTSIDGIPTFNTDIPMTVPSYRSFAKILSDNFITTTSRGKNAMKGAELVLKIYERAIEYLIMYGDGKMGPAGQSCIGDKGRWITNYAVDARYIAAFKCVTQFCGGGLISFYYEQGMPLKLSFSISTLGRVIMYIAGESTDADNHEEDYCDDYSCTDDYNYE